MRRVTFVFAILSVLSLAMAVSWLAWPAVAVAAGAKSVAILVEGAEAESVAAEVQSVLPPELSAVDAKEFADALKKAGQRGQLGNTLAVKGVLRDKILERVQKAMEATGAEAAILGRVRIGKLGKEVWLVWLGKGGDVRVDQAVSLRGDNGERREGFRGALDGPAKELVPPPVVTTGPETPPPGGGGKGDGEGDEGKDEPKSKRTPHLPSTSIFSIAAMYELGGRHVTFSDAISKNIRPYDVLPVSMISFAGEVYPGAPTGITVLRDIGLTARFSMAIGLSSSTEGGTQEIGSSFLRFRGGLKWRFVPGTEQGPVLAISGEFGLDQFTFEDAGALAPQVPAVDYQYVRAGGEARFPLGPVALELGGGYRGLLGVGETGGRFRDTSALAFDVVVGFYVPLPAGFEVRLQGDYTRVFYAFKPVPGDEYVAGGAVDEMLGARLGVAYVY